MAHTELELDSVDFITIGTVGPKGRRQFYLQGGTTTEMISLLIEKEQARAVAESLSELLDDLLRRNPQLSGDTSDMVKLNMELRDPIEPRFRVGQFGVGYNPDRDMILIEAIELLGLSSIQQDDDTTTDADADSDAEQPSVVRFWVTRPQLRALCVHTQNVVRSGRVDPQSNGRMLYYWT